MKVKELIEILKTLDQEKDVFCFDSDYGWEKVTKIEFRTDVKEVGENYTIVT